MKTKRIFKPSRNIVDTIDIATIRAMREEGCFMREIAEALGVSLSTIDKALKVYGEKEAKDEVRACYKSESIRTIKNQE